jgi:hypothetical protein
MRTSGAAGIITLPSATTVPGRILTFKDISGSFGVSTLTLSTIAGQFFEDNRTQYVINQKYGSATFVASSDGRWYQLGGTYAFENTISSLHVSSITGDGSLLTGLNVGTSVGSTVAGLASAGYISSTQLTSTIDGLGTANYISSAQLTSTAQGLQEYVSSFVDPTELTSTIIGLGSAGFLSSFDTKIASTVDGLSSAGFVSSSQLASTVTGLGTANYISSSQLISSTH